MPNDSPISVSADRPAKFRKRPVVVEAVQFSGDNRFEVEAFVGRNLVEALRVDGGRGPALIVQTLEGDHRADVGDFIIRGVKGEFYPCKPAIFELTYEPAADRPVENSELQEALTDLITEAFIEGSSHNNTKKIAAARSRIEELFASLQRQLGKSWQEQSEILLHKQEALDELEAEISRLRADRLTARTDA